MRFFGVFSVSGVFGFRVAAIFLSGVFGLFPRSDIDYDVETKRDEIDDVRVTISASVSSLRVL